MGVLIIKADRSPKMALLWSVAIPGFGQLYNKDYLTGLVLVTLEFIINNKANLNMAILYSFRWQMAEVYQVVNFQWLLFYPCVYAYSLWQAFNKAVEINRRLEQIDTDKLTTKTYFNGVFIGFAMAGTLGVIYSFAIGPIFSGIIGGIIGAIIGSLLEMRVRNRGYLNNFEKRYI